MATRIDENIFDTVNELRKLADKIESGEVEVIMQPKYPEVNSFYCATSKEKFYRDSGFYTLTFEVFEKKRRYKDE